MAEDDQKTPAQDPTDEAPPAPIQTVRIDSLSQLVEETAKGAAQPEPILLEWFLPPTKEAPMGRRITLEIETRFPDDHWIFGIKYQTEAKVRLQEKVADAKGNMVQKNPLADIEFLTKELVARPTWLHNVSALQKFKDNVPSFVFAELRRKLMLVGRLDGDFFADYQQLTIPRTLLLSAYDSVSGSDSTQAPSTGNQQNGSSPGSSTTPSVEPKPAVSASPTTSGSSPSTPTTVPAV